VRVTHDIARLRALAVTVTEVHPEDHATNALLWAIALKVVRLERAN